MFAAAVIAFAGITFGVFVGQHGALRLHNGHRGKIFGSDKLQLFALAGKFFGYRIKYGGIGFLQIGIHNKTLLGRGIDKRGPPRAEFLHIFLGNPRVI